MPTSTKKPTCRQIMAELKKLGTEQTRKTLRRHGAPEPLFGVKIGDLKPIQKKVKKDHDLALELYATGNADAMYLAGLIADEERMTRSDLNCWVREAEWHGISGMVAAVAAETPHAVALGTKWIEAKREGTAATGWATLTNFVSIAPDEQIDHHLFEQLLERVEREIHEERNEVRDRMNMFVISVGSYVTKLTKRALQAAARIGRVEVDHGDTSCQTPDAGEYIRKIEGMGRLGRRRKSARC